MGKKCNHIRFLEQQAALQQKFLLENYNKAEQVFQKMTIVRSIIPKVYDEQENVRAALQTLWNQLMQRGRENLMQMRQYQSDYDAALQNQEEDNTLRAEAVQAKERRRKEQSNEELNGSIRRTWKKQKTLQRARMTDAMKKRRSENEVERRRQKKRTSR
jgi:hypothetical protein